MLETFAVFLSFLLGILTRGMLLRLRISRARLASNGELARERVLLTEAQRLMSAGMPYSDAAKAAGFSCGGELTGAFFHVTGKGPRDWVSMVPPRGGAR